MVETVVPQDAQSRWQGPQPEAKEKVKARNKVISLSSLPVPPVSVGEGELGDELAGLEDVEQLVDGGPLGAEGVLDLGDGELPDLTLGHEGRQAGEEGASQVCQGVLTRHDGGGDVQSDVRPTGPKYSISTFGFGLGLDGKVACFRSHYQSNPKFRILLVVRKVTYAEGCSRCFFCSCERLFYLSTDEADFFSIYMP